LIAADVVETLRQRRNWLTARITAKQSIGWDVEWDTRERDALTATLTHLAATDGGERRQSNEHVPAAADGSMVFDCPACRSGRGR
jgi:hypothetical protein